MGDINGSGVEATRPEAPARAPLAADRQASAQALAPPPPQVSATATVPAGAERSHVTALNQILERVEAYHPNAALDKVRAAFAFAAERWKGHKRLSGEPFITHPLEVMGIVADLKLDTDSLCAALLHDILETPGLTRDDLQRRFGDEVALMVESLHRMNKQRYSGSSDEQQTENFRKLLIAMSRDLRVVLIKLADRLHNMRTLRHVDEDRRHAMAQETLDIYAPIANRLGIGWVKVELENLSFSFLYPEAYEDLQQKVAMAEDERQRYIKEVIQILDRVLRDNQMGGYELQGRPKHLFSLYRKMILSQIDFSQVYDVLAFRIITDNVAQCYEALGIVHNLWKPIAGRFKDYIALPKTNRYQSLHTTVLGPYRKLIEIQIRTHEMHRINEEGIAAHWMYKEGKEGKEGKDGKPALSSDERDFAWLRQLMDFQQELSDPKDFAETVKIDLFADEVYVFTPDGALYSFPKGATPVDFAFSVHTEVGHRCTGAKVNNQIVPLKYQMRNGDIIEILTSPNQQPKQDWLSFVVTHRAKQKIRQHIRKVQRERSRDGGRDGFEKALRRKGYSFVRLEKSGRLLEVARNHKCANLDELLILIGQGKLQADLVVGRIAQEDADAAAAAAAAKVPEPDLPPPAPSTPSRSSHGGVRVAGISDMMIRIARCCAPVPDEPIIGCITRGRGVTVHARECPHAQSTEPGRLVECHWDIPAGRSAASRRMVVPLRVVTNDRPGILAAITLTFADSGVNITQANCRTLQDRRAVNTFSVQVTDLRQLNNTLRAISRIQGVLTVERVRS
jgi:guanosine-3',5'-bis(diphosphate) 3'-pyrophosphohydrolase